MVFTMDEGWQVHSEKTIQELSEGISAYQGYTPETIVINGMKVFYLLQQHIKSDLV